METIYMETHSTDPRYNLAFEEYVLTQCTQGDYLLLWQNANAVIVGRNQNTQGEINPTFVQDHGIAVVRRMTGGGAVYHDMGNLNYSFITHVDNQEKMTMERFTTPVVQALQALGLEAEASGRNDILVSGCKVSGTAQRIHHGRILHHGTLLFDANPDMIVGALQVDESKFASKSAKSVRARVGNIRSFLNKDMDMASFWDYLKGALSQNGFVEQSLGQEALAAVETIKVNRYDTWEWNFGQTPKYTFTNRQRFAGGGLQCTLDVEKGYIKNLAFTGDFLAQKDLTPVYEALNACPLRRDSLVLALAPLALNVYFGAITLEEVVQLLLDTHA